MIVLEICMHSLSTNNVMLNRINHFVQMGMPTSCIGLGIKYLTSLLLAKPLALTLATRTGTLSGSSKGAHMLTWLHIKLMFCQLSTYVRWKTPHAPLSFTFGLWSLACFLLFAAWLDWRLTAGVKPQHGQA
uniref:Uncharacterized protein n=1 Tax=Dunaliella tertiolecta TaxID=3047 RepID=A0A7S3VQ32_DUNTE